MMNPIHRHLSVLEQTTTAKVRWLPATDEADAERHRAERAARGDTEPVRFIITGVPRSSDLGNCPVADGE